MFCANDEMAIGVIKYLTTNGYNLPQDIKVIGFDNIASCEYVKPKLSTIDTNRAEWSQNLAEMMIDLIEEKVFDENKFLPKYQIIRRESF